MKYLRLADIPPEIRTQQRYRYYNLLGGSHNVGW
jgi:hypothetical protein